MSARSRPTRAQLEARLAELEARDTERERMLLDLEVHREEVRLQNQQLQQIREVLEESRDRYAALYDFAPLGYLTLDGYGLVLESNLTAAGLLGRPRSSLVGTPLVHYVTAGTRRDFLEHMKRCREGKGPLATELEVDRRGVAIPVELFSREFEGRERTEFLTAVTDLSERKLGMQERERLTVAHAREHAASEAKGRFLAVLSHELRTPLTPVLATLTGLRRSSRVPADLEPALSMIRRNVELEARLIDDLLDLTRIEQEKLQVRRDPVDVHELVRRVAEDVPALPHAARVRLELDLGAPAPYVEGDAARLLQVLWNLVGNALKFTPKGGLVRLLTRQRNGALEIEVSDSGVGIPREKLAQLFLPFRQLLDASPGASGGLGLGLSIARQLVERHGGTIAAGSEGVGKGSVFTVSLPLTRRRPSASAAAADDGAERGEAAGPSVLLVEDHADTAEALGQLLALEGFEVTVADSFAAALAASENDPDVLISDIALPDGSGLDLMRRLRERDSAVSGIALSGFGTTEDVRRSLDAGFREHLTKPVDVERLVAAVRRLCEGSPPG